MMRLTYTMLVVLCVCASSRGAETNVVAGKPFLLHLNGVGGERSIDHTLVRGLRLAGYEGEVRIYDWTGGKIGIEALQGRERHQTEARKIAEILVARAKANPGLPIYITAHSGGAGLAAWALELLPEDVRVESVYLFAPALSPDYDLTAALRRVAKNLCVFSSPHDTVVLSTGCKLFGTIDGVKCEAAGVKGFVKPATADATEYGKVLHYPYQRAWLLKYGNAGSHICAMRLRFARDYVGPLFVTGVAPADAKVPTSQPVSAR